MYEYGADMFTLGVAWQGTVVFVLWKLYVHISSRQWFDISPWQYAKPGLPLLKYPTAEMDEPGLVAVPFCLQRFIKL